MERVERQTASVITTEKVDAHGTYNQEGRGVKADRGKLQWHLLPSIYLRGLVRVLMKGAVKYTAHNWRKGMPHSQTYDAVRRHLDAWEAGEDFDVGTVDDPGTNEHHIDCALAELLFLRAHIMEHPELDDRYRDEVSHV